MRPGFCLPVVALALLLTGTAQSGPRTNPSVTAAGSGLVVDGRPYFPILTWAACPQDVDASLALGVTVFMEHGEGCGAEQDLLDAIGYRAYYVPTVGAPGLADDARLLGYTQPDEPDGHGIPPEALGAAPGKVVFLTLTTRFLHGLPRFRDPGAKGVSDAYAAKASVIGVALYPLTHLCGVHGLDAVYDTQRDFVAMAGGRPTFQWIETGSLEGVCGQPVTPAAVRAEAWLAIAGGARGLGYFTYGWPDGRAQSFAVAPEIADELARTSGRIQQLAPMLLSPSLPVASGAGQVVKLGARTWNGETYVIAVNSTDVPVHWTRGPLPGLASQKVRVLGENRTLRPVNGVLRDAFAPLGVHVYAYRAR